MKLNSRINALRSYFLEVTKDLVQKGKLRHKKGESLEKVILSEVDIALLALAKDLKEIGLEIGSSLFQAGTQKASDFVKTWLTKVIIK